MGITEGENATLTEANDGTSGSSERSPSFGSTAKGYTLSKNRAGAAAGVTGSGALGAYGEVWVSKQIFNPNPNLGDYVSTAEITIDGFWSAYLHAIEADARVRLSAFVRDGNTILDEVEVLDKVGNSSDLWSGNENFSETMVVDLETSNGYEFGVRAYATASTPVGPHSLADAHTGGNTIEYTGRVSFDSIDVNWI